MALIWQDSSKDEGNDERSTGRGSKSSDPLTQVQWKILNDI
jgi:hypothetical protein